MPLETEERKRMRRLAEARDRKARNTRESKAGNLSATSPNKPSERAARSSRSSSSSSSGGAKTGKNFNKGLDAAIKAMSPAQRKAYEESLGQTTSAKERRGKELEFLRSGGTKSKDYAGSGGGSKKVTSADKGSGSAAPKVGNKSNSGSSRQTFSQAFAAARKAQGPGGTFTWNGKTYTTNRADDKATSKANGKTTSRAATAKMPEKPKRPTTRGGKLGMNSPEMREYRKKLAAYRKAQEASSKKAYGGRVMMKKAAAKKAAKKKAARRP